jgi:glycine hydroxymethyltransferase
MAQTREWAQGLLGEKDPEAFRLLQQEEQRQQGTVNLIAAENYASRAVLEAQGSVLTNKYAEGYPHRRYYAGCGIVDEVETLAIERARKLFGAEHANVQPHSGAQANMAAYFACLSTGDTVLGMSLAHGGHLTHGSPVNFSGRLYKFIPYGVSRETELVDYADIESLARMHRPRLILAGASSYPRRLDFARFRAIADEVGALFMVDMAHLAGLVAGGVHPSPTPHAHLVTSTTHKTLRGPRGGFILCKQEFASKIDAAVFPGIQGGPLVHVILAKAVAFGEAMKPEFARYQAQLVQNAQALARELQALGLRPISGGTDNHLLLVDLTPAGITGKEAEEALEMAGITVNRNMIPFDPRPPQQASGLRLGTPAVTTRGMGLPEMRLLAGLIGRVLTHPGDNQVEAQVRQEVERLCSRFPIPGWQALAT